MKQTLFYLLVIVSLSSCANYHSRIHFSKGAQQQKKEILATTPQQTEHTEARVHHPIKEEKAKITQAQEEEKIEKEQVRPIEKFISNRGADTYFDDHYSKIEQEALEPKKDRKEDLFEQEEDPYRGWSIAALVLLLLGGALLLFPLSIYVLYFIPICI